MPSLYTETMHWLTQYNIRPNKQLGQNFLIDPIAIEKIIDVLKPTASDKILEIGSGTGNITLQLLESGAQLP